MARRRSRRRSRGRRSGSFFGRVRHHARRAGRRARGTGRRLLSGKTKKYLTIAAVVGAGYFGYKKFVK